MDPLKGAGSEPFLPVPTDNPDDKTRAREQQSSSVSSASLSPSPASIPPSKPSEQNLDKELEMQQFVEDFLDDIGEDSYAVVFYLGFLAVMGVSIIGFIYLPWSWIVAIICVLIGFIIFRHISVKNDHPAPSTGRRWATPRDPNSSEPDISKLPAVYFMYILGSGGHTTEMLETVKRKFNGQGNQHRRYVFNTGDDDSHRRLIATEVLIRQAFPEDRRGTIDSFSLPRARRVHQSLLTAPLTCLLTAIHAINALTCEPVSRPLTRYGRQFKYPHVIVTNGPATGFIVCLVAHLLKLFYLVPQNRLKMVYIESWARARSLSLTGRLFWWTGIADMFCVQHEELARRTPGAVCVGVIAACLPAVTPPPPQRTVWD